MAVKEKKVVQSVLVCDYCDNDIQGSTATRIEGKASGYMKRDNFELDLCEDCSSKIGLKRRGRRPAGEVARPKVQTANAAAPKKRGRPPKKKDDEQIAVATVTPKTVEVTADDWS